MIGSIIHIDDAVQCNATIDMQEELLGLIDSGRTRHHRGSNCFFFHATPERIDFHHFHDGKVTAQFKLCPERKQKTPPNASVQRGSKMLPHTSPISLEECNPHWHRQEKKELFITCTHSVTRVVWLGNSGLSLI
jgi:hypothetical protein